MKILVSGLLNVETTVKINSFPISYYPIDYPFFGIRSEVSGVAYNLAKAFQTLGNEVELFSFLGKDEEAQRILHRLEQDKIATEHISQELTETPSSVVLYDKEGRRQIYCDLKDIQDRTLTFDEARIGECDMAAVCNTNFNRALIRRAKELGKVTATDVHVLSDVEDSYNKDFMQYADILFLSDENIPCKPEQFLWQLKETYPCKIIIMGRGGKGAMLYERSTDCVSSLEAAKAEKIVNTVGAGDALFSGFLHFYGKGYAPIEALKRAETFAAIKIGYNGASVGFAKEEAVQQAYESQNVKSVPLL